MRIIKSQFCEECQRQNEAPCGCQHGHDIKPIDGSPDLDNPSLDGHNEPEALMTEMPKKVILIKMVGNPSDIGIEEILKMIEQVIPVAEKSGMDDQVEQLQAAAAKLEKAAEYEGWGVYWIANGRAFEKSYKEKKEQKGDAPNAATEAWMETLEEFQKAILDDTFSFTEKYASKKAKEEADSGGVGGGGSSGIMSRDMTNRYKKVKEKAEKEGITEGEALSDWLDEQQGRKKKAASVMLLNKISARMERGSDPGVAVYEAIDDLQNMTNNVKKEALAELGNVYAKALAEDKEDVREVLAFGILDRLTSPLKGLWGRMTGGIGDFFSRQWAKGSPASKKLRAINRIRPLIQKKLNEFLRSMATGGAVPATSIQQALNTRNFYPLVASFMTDVSKAIAVRPLPDPNNFSQSGYLNAEQYKNFLAELVLAMDQVNEQNAYAASRAGSTGVRPDITKMTYPEDARLQANVIALVNRINTITNDLELALPNHKIPPNVFDPKEIKSYISSINIPLLMSDSMKNIDKGEDRETESSRISSQITSRMDEDLDKYIGIIRPIIQQLNNSLTVGISRQQQMQINKQIEDARSSLREIRTKWDETKLKIEQEVLKTLDSRYKRITGLRQGLLQGPQQQQPAAAPAGA